MTREDYLFNKRDAFGVRERQLAAANQEVASFDGNRLLNTNVDDLVGYFVDKYRIDVPLLHEESAAADQRESSRDVSGDPRRMAYYSRRGPLHVTGAEVTIEVPFSGDPQLFDVQPSTYTSMPPRGIVRGNVLVFQIWSDNPEAQQIKSAFEHWLEDIRQHLQWLQATFGPFNEDLAAVVRAAINDRRDKLLRNRNLVAALGIPLKRRGDASQTYAAPEVKRKLTPQVPTATKGAFKPEPVLEEAEYQHILDVIESMVHVMERSPKAFHNIDEEALRTHFLVQLNGHYEGQATGETFNYQGKTDILVRSGDRNIFVAECKFWGGPAKMTETIDQLLGYLSWRDSKAAILVFNRSRNFSKVLAAISETAAAHANCRKFEGARGASGFRYTFRHKDDPAKSLHLTILAFDVPRAEVGAATG